MTEPNLLPSHAFSAKNSIDAGRSLKIFFTRSRIHWNLPSVALWLLKNGADPNLTDQSGNTALHEAARRGINPKVVQAILEKGGEPSARNQDGVTPLDLAVEKKRTKLIPLLGPITVNRITPLVFISTFVIYHLR